MKLIVLFIVLSLSVECADKKPNSPQSINEFVQPDKIKINPKIAGQSNDKDEQPHKHTLKIQKPEMPADTTLNEVENKTAWKVEQSFSRDVPGIGEPPHSTASNQASDENLRYKKEEIEGKMNMREQIKHDEPTSSLPSDNPKMHETKPNEPIQ